MGIQLTKGGRFNLSKEAPDLKKLAIGLGWEVSDSGQNYDIDASVFMLGAAGKVIHDKYFVFYNNLKSLDVENANFFYVDDLGKITDDQLYERLLNEFPSWIRDAKRKRILN